jgi:hypothetical protein
MRYRGELQHFRPYWDERLTKDRFARRRFCRQLLQVKLGGFRTRLTGRIGFFAASKKDGFQSLIVDGREPFMYHHPPPHTDLGTPTALAGLDLRPSRVPPGTPADPHGTELDLVDGLFGINDKASRSMVLLRVAGNCRVLGC